MMACGVFFQTIGNRLLSKLMVSRFCNGKFTSKQSRRPFVYPFGFGMAAKKGATQMTGET